MHESVINLHMHTPYSDGHYTHAQIAKAAFSAGLDAVIVTDHNIWVRGHERYYHQDQHRILMLVGEEVHDQARDPQKNHLLIFGTNREMASFAHDPQILINTVRDSNALSFLAHPFDPAAPAFHQDDLSWEDLHVSGFNGIELWNAMTEFKSLLKSVPHGIFYAYLPKLIARGPLPKAIQLWDELHRKGEKIVAIGGSDAHAFPVRLGPLFRILFPYEFHFRAVNTHILTPEPLNGELATDRRLILNALKQGNAFIGYDLPGSTRGFRFTAQGKSSTAWMGDEIKASGGITLQIRLPQKVECRLIKDGEIIKTWRKRMTCTHITTEPGVYRIEAYIHYLGMKRAWIFSNPIYIRP